MKRTCQLSSLIASICSKFRRESGYCAIEWSSPNNTQSVNGSLGYFTLSGLAATTALTTADIKVSTISLEKIFENI
jgi:hypothetical protein